MALMNCETPYSHSVYQSLIDVCGRLVFVFDPTDDQSIPQGKQTKRPHHIFYTPCSGIWQTVWLESVPKTYIANMDVAAGMDGNGKCSGIATAILVTARC